MKYLQIAIRLIVSSLSFACSIAVTSCASSEQTVKANKIINIALDFSERHGIISKEDVEAAKKVNDLVIPAELPEATVETTSGK